MRNKDLNHSVVIDVGESEAGPLIMQAQGPTVAYLEVCSARLAIQD